MPAGVWRADRSWDQGVATSFDAGIYMISKSHTERYEWKPGCVIKIWYATIGRVVILFSQKQEAKGKNPIKKLASCSWEDKKDRYSRCWDTISGPTRITQPAWRWELGIGYGILAAIFLSFTRAKKRKMSSDQRKIVKLKRRRISHLEHSRKGGGGGNQNAWSWSSNIWYPDHLEQRFFFCTLPKNKEAKGENRKRKKIGFLFLGDKRKSRCSRCWRYHIFPKKRKKIQYLTYFFLLFFIFIILSNIFYYYLV